MQINDTCRDYSETIHLIFSSIDRHPKQNFQKTTGNFQNLNCYNVICPLSFISFNLHKSTSNNAQLNQILNTQFPSYHHIFTNGSKDSDGRRTGYEFFSKKGYASISDAELRATRKTILLIEKTKLKKIS